MSKTPGVADGFTTGPAAMLDQKIFNTNRLHHNHAFAAPGYPIAHPGIFPQNPDADNYSIEAWLKFDYRAGWGGDDFEKQVSDGKIKVAFPKEWESDVDRQEAHRIVDENLAKLRQKKELRRQVMENGSKLEGPFFDNAPQAGKKLRFSYKVTNTNPGHNMPSGSLGAN